MQYFIFLLIFCFFVFLFTLFGLSKDDFVLFRKNVDTEKIFNTAFMVGIWGLFCARLFFVILNFRPIYLNLLAFVLFPYFPGLSLPGGLLGGSILLIFLLKGKKYPEGRIFDFFIASFLGALCIGAIILFGIDFYFTKKIPLFIGFQAIISFVLFLIAFRATQNQSIKEGSNGLMSIILLSVFFIASLLVERPYVWIHIGKESSLWIVNLLVAFIFLLKQDSLFAFFRLIRGK